MKRFTRILSLLLVVFALAGLAGSALAATLKPAIEPRTLWAGCEYYSSVDFVDMPENAKILSVKSSRPGIIKAHRESSNIYDNYLEPLKAGKSKITVKYKYEGKTSTISATFTVKKYPNPLTSVTVDGKARNLKANPYYLDINKYKGTKPLVKVKLAKGWKIAYTWGYTEKPGAEDSFKEFNPRNGRSFKLPKGYEAGVFFTMANAKGEEIQYGIHFYR